MMDNMTLASKLEVNYYTLYNTARKDRDETKSTSPKW